MTKITFRWIAWLLCLFKGPSYLVLWFQNQSSCKTFDMKHESEPVGLTHFRMNGVALRLVLTLAKGTSEMANCYLCFLFSL